VPVRSDGTLFIIIARVGAARGPPRPVPPAVIAPPIMRRPSPIVRCGLALALASPAVACGGNLPAPRGAAPATMAAGPLARGPSEPVRGLPMPSLDVAWTPPMLVAGDVDQLGAALGGHDTIALQLGARFGGSEATERVEALVRALHPGVAIAAEEVEAEPFAGVALPLVREPDDGQARPRYRFEGRLPVPEGAGTDGAAVLVIAEAQLDPGQWRALSASAVGSCQAPMVALAAGQEQSLAELEPFLDHADATLWQVYRPALQATLPRLVAELEPYRTSDHAADHAFGARAELDAREREQH
jgi:hypothetical protein